VTEGPLGEVVDASIQSVRRAMREREAFQRQLSYLLAPAESDEYQGAELRITASVGIAISEQDVETTHERLLRRADLAVYEAKDAGGDTWRSHRPEPSGAADRLTSDVAPG
jgi:GGDEF domain-containing protein